MGLPVVTKASGGMPVTVAANGYGTPMTEATNGYGVPVTVVASGGLPVVGISGGGGGGYTGPGDVVSGATAFWGLRAYTAAKAAALSPCLDLGLTTDGTSPVTINFTASGYIDTAAVTAAFAANKTKVMKLYDQVGSNHQIPNFSSNHTYAPRLQANAGPGGNTLAMFFNATAVGDEDTMVSSAITVPQPYSYLALTKASATLTGIRAIAGAYPNDTIYLWYRTTDTAMKIASGGSESGRPFSLGAWHSLSVAVTSAASGTAAFDIDGSQGGSAGIGTVGWSTDIVVLGGSAVALWDGWICEFGIWPIGLSPAQQTLLNTNMHTRWGF